MDNLLNRTPGVAAVAVQALLTATITVQEVLLVAFDEQMALHVGERDQAGE